MATASVRQWTTTESPTEVERVKTLQVTEKPENYFHLERDDDNDLMIINKSNHIRMAVEELRVMGRFFGVRLISLRGKDAIAAICKVPTLMTTKTSRMKRTIKMTPTQTRMESGGTSSSRVMRDTTLARSLALSSRSFTPS